MGIWQWARPWGAGALSCCDGHRSGAGAAVDAQAQTQLPGVVVTTPSPVTPSPPAAQAPAAPAQAAAAAASRPQLQTLRGTPLSDLSRPELRGDHGRDARQQLLSQPSATLGDALAARPGIASTTFAPGSSRPVIRGLSGFRVAHPGERALDGRRVGAQRRSRHAHRSAGRRPGRGGAGAGDAALRVAGHRRRRQRRQQPHSDRDPGQRHPGGDPRRLQHGGRRTQRRGDRRGRRRQFRDPRRYLRALGQRLSHPATGAGRPIPASRARATRSAAPMSSRTASSASPIPRSPAPTLFPASRPPSARTTSSSTRRNGPAGANGASTISGSRPSASGSAPPTTSTTRRDSLPVPSIGSTFLQKQYETRMEVQHLPVKTALGVLRGASGIQWSNRDLGAPVPTASCSIRPTRKASPASSSRSCS